MKTEVMFHCGNAPKLERVIELTIALAARDEATAKGHLRNDLVWTEVGAGKTTDFASLGVTLTEKPAALKNKNRKKSEPRQWCYVRGFADDQSFFFCSVVQFVNTAKNTLVKNLHMYFIEKTR